jgi:hypothetical protein
MANGDIRITDGTLSMEGGIDSGRTPTIAGPENPNGLKRNQNAWITNATCRGGGILQRTGWKPGVKGAPWSGLYQGGYLYDPGTDFPYLMLDIGGRTYQVRVDTDFSVVDVTAGTGPNPSNIPQHWMVQGEEFLVIQDGVSEPLVWDGTVLRRISAVGAGVKKLPTGTAMDYFMGRIWVASQGRAYLAGDIVGAPGTPSSGTAPYQFRDSILNITENAYMVGGGAFIVPTTAGNIRAIFHSANLDTSLGQGQLFVATRKTIYSVNVVPDRAQWSTLSEPLQRVAQLNFGTTSDRSVVPVNGDVFLQSPPNGDIRSFAVALRYFHQWGNVPISRNMNRVLRFNDRALLRYGSGMEFDNRLWQTVLPYQTPAGVAHKLVMLLDFDLISSFEERLPPAWEGTYEAMPVMQLFSGDFGGLQRAFAVVWSDKDQEIQVWELTQFDRWDSQVGNDGDRVTWYFETPAYTFKNPFALKQLESAEVWIDKLLGKVEIEAYYRPDSYPCWIPWHAWNECTAKDCTEDSTATDCPASSYPQQPFCESFKATKVLPKPPSICIDASKRPSDWAYQFQMRFVIKGWCRFRGVLLHALPRDKRPFEGKVC